LLVDGRFDRRGLCHIVLPTKRTWVMKHLRMADALVCAQQPYLSRTRVTFRLGPDWTAVNTRLTKMGSESLLQTAKTCSRNRGSGRAGG
jgi:hypothetical protein